MRSDKKFSKPQRGASLGLKLATWTGVLFLHIPLALIALYAFSSEDKSYVFPPPGLTTQWFGVALERQAVMGHPLREDVLMHVGPPGLAYLREAR